jgi:hypothetical protein
VLWEGVAVPEWWQNDPEGDYNADYDLDEEPQGFVWSRLRALFKSVLRRLDGDDGVTARTLETDFNSILLHRFQHDDTGTNKSQLMERRFAVRAELGKQISGRLLELIEKHRDDDAKLQELRELTYSWLSETCDAAYDPEFEGKS